MKFEDGAQIVTDDFWYDLTKGGYIKPDELLLDHRDAERVNAAISVLEEFYDAAERQGVLEDM